MSKNELKVNCRCRVFLYIIRCMSKIASCFANPALELRLHLLTAFSVLATFITMIVILFLEQRAQ